MDPKYLDMKITDIVFLKSLGIVTVYSYRQIILMPTTIKRDPFCLVLNKEPFIIKRESIQYKVSGAARESLRVSRLSVSFYLKI